MLKSQIHQPSFGLNGRFGVHSRKLTILAKFGQSRRLVDISFHTANMPINSIFVALGVHLTILRHQKFFFPNQLITEGVETMDTYMTIQIQELGRHSSGKSPILTSFEYYHGAQQMFRFKRQINILIRCLFLRGFF